MLLPYATDQLTTRRPFVTWALILCSGAITAFALMPAAHGSNRAGELAANLGIVPGHFQPATLITYSFIHVSPTHLIVNLFFLWVFGSGVENAVGAGMFFLLYVCSGAVGGTLQYLVTLALLSGGHSMPIVGASASCAGMIGVYAVRYYRARLTFIGLAARPHVVVVVMIVLAAEIGAGLWDLAVGAAPGGVAHWAHVGGFVFGLCCGYLLKLDRQGQTAYLVSDAKQAMEGNEPGEAIRRWEAVLARNPENDAARVELARGWHLLGDEEQASHHYLEVLHLYLSSDRRPEAAQVYAELRQCGLRPVLPPGPELYKLGSALEEAEEFALAAEVLRAVWSRSAETPEAETALLKAVRLYVERLSQPEEGRVLAQIFLERYPNSAWRARAAELLKQAGSEDREHNSSSGHIS